ncbi:subtilisin-like protease SBT4.3 [Musa acuminata AAA Group]|uniref:subtilisin-like protease SBT4.3 n=1 Tax=Musa acuminata AAA Group TaxID=214697 RepID=UPI0031D72232
MAVLNSSTQILFSLPVLISFSLLISIASADEERKVYIVYMGDSPSSDYSAQPHHNLLNQVLEGLSSTKSLIHSYRSFNGLAARLTAKEKERIAGIKGVVSVFPSKNLQPSTTRSWDFLSFPESVKRNLPMERDVMVGVIDTGIWPESASFRDEGFGPPPRRWKGACENFKCNNKIIGARYFNSYNDTTHEASPRDYDGHGTHTASTVAGRSVRNVSLYGLAGGMARGAVPSARLAVYKVCWPAGCAGEDLLAAFDHAIADGVDIISISIGSERASDYFEDPIAIGAFHAMKKGILTSASGGNEGRSGRGTVGNVAPWMLVSAASSIDRRIIDTLVTGDRRTIVGASINTFPTQRKSYPFIYFGNGTFPPSNCTQLDKNLVKGKIVLCGSPSDGSGPLLAGAEGAVMLDKRILDSSRTFPLPALLVGYSQGKKLMEYIRKTKNPVANIHKSKTVFDSKAPVVASFSSRGPNMITPNILKPDISAPGVEILAAWSPEASMSSYPNDTRSVMYNIISGTSMACPHVTGAAAFLKSFHPEWSPAAIMSALMTTATPMNPSLHRDAELAYGAGQLNPIKALDPGLVYDASEKDYVQMLCDEGYNASTIRLITGDNSSCSGDSTRSTSDLNYPSMALYVKPAEQVRGKFSRTVTNVGDANSTYKAVIKTDPNIKVSLSPTVLSFKRRYGKQQFMVRVSGGPLALNSLASAAITWSDGKHSVRSPISIFTDFTV